MNSEERPATGRDRLVADQQHTVPARPVKAHFAYFSPGAAIVRYTAKPNPSPVEHLLLRRAVATVLKHSVTPSATPRHTFVENPGYARRIRRSR